jgi:RNA polymerase sigma factor (sigma-70 family)
MLDDRQLVAALLGSDRDTALSECIRRYGSMVKRTAWRITGDEHRAEDACQAVFMVLVRKAGSLVNVNLLGAWLYRVAVATAANTVKSQVRRQRREQESVMVAQAQSKPTTTLLKSVDQAVNRLPDKYRQVIVAHYFEGRTYAEVAAGLGLPEETVKKRGGRGVDRLRQLLARSAAPTLSVAALTSLLSAEATAASAAALATGQVAVIHAAATGTGAAVQVTALADLAIKAMFWAKMKVYALIMASVAVVAVPAYVALKPSGTYSTNFPLTENPISEGGAWVRGGVEGLDWNNPKTSSGHATASVAASRYNDCIAHPNRPSFHAAQYAQGTVYLANGYTGNGGKHAVELLLRFSISAHNARGYEVLWDTSGGIAVVRWNGPPGNFTSLWTGPAPKPVDGDVLRAEIAGRVISVYRNGSRLATIDVTSQGGTVWSSGQPGIGFWPVDGALPDSFGWKSFEAGSLK